MSPVQQNLGTSMVEARDCLIYPRWPCVRQRTGTGQSKRHLDAEWQVNATVFVSSFSMINSRSPGYVEHAATLSIPTSRSGPCNIVQRG